MSVVEDHKQNKAFATQNALMSLAAFVGSLFAGYIPELITNFSNFTIDEPEPYRYTLLLVVVIALVAFLISLTIKEPAHESHEEAVSHTEFKPKTKGLGLAPAVLVLIAVMSGVRFLQVAGLGTVSVYFNVYMDTELALSPSLIGLIASIGRLISVPTVLLAPRLIRGSSTAMVAFWASLATAVFLLPIAFVPRWEIAALAYICVLALTNLRFTAFLVYILTLVPKRQQAVITGAGEMAAGFSFALMALSGGYIVTVFSFRELFFLGFVLSALGSLIFIWYVKREKAKRGLVLESSA